MPSHAGSCLPWLCGRLTRLTLFAVLISLGNAQLFFGYGESYTLVTALDLLFTYWGLRRRGVDR